MRNILLLSAFLTGFSAIALEVLWTRVMVMVVGGSVYAFALVLIAFLVGIALGSLLISPFIGRLRNVLLWFAVIEVLIGITVIVSVPLFGNLPFWFLEIYQSFGKSFEGLQFGLWLMAASVMIVPTLLMGMAFPVIIRAVALTRTEAVSGGSVVGSVYAINTIGGVLGAVAAGFVLIPTIGVQKGILVAGTIYILIGLGILFYMTIRSLASIRLRFVSISVLLFAAGTILAGFNFSAWEEDLLASGFYKDPTLYTGKTKEELLRQLKRNKTLYSREGITAHVVVTRGKDGVLSLKINGKADASTGSDMENQLLLGHLPMLLHPSTGSGSKEVLVVGLGSGITLGSILSHDPKHVDAIEIEGAVVEAAKFFNEYSNNALSDPRVNIVVADGRHYLMASGKKYDVITSEPSNPWLSGSSKLFTKEYFQLYKMSIKDDGVVIHWINLHSIDQESLKRVLRAYLDVFPHVAGFGVPASNDLLLVGANKPIAFDYPVLVERLTGFRHSGNPAQREHPESLTAVGDAGQARLADAMAKRASMTGFETTPRLDLAKVRIKEPFEILAYFVMGDKEIKKLVGNTRANTDNSPYVEFSAPKYLYQSVAVNPWRVIYENLSPIESVFKNTSEVSLAAFGGNSSTSEVGTKEYHPQDTSEVVLRLRRTSEVEKADKFRRSRLLTQVYSIEKNVGEGIKEGEKALKIDPNNTFIREKLAQFYFEEGTGFFNQSQYSKAISSLSKSLELKKTAEAYFNLGQTYGWDGDLEKARDSYELAVKLDPEFEQGWMWLGDTASQLGDLNDAISSYQEVLKLSPKNVEAHFGLGNLYILRRDFGKAEEFLNKALNIDPESKEARELLEKIP